MEDLETWLERVYQADGDLDQLETLYDEWASDYDQQLWASGNPYIAIATGMVGRHIQDYSARILDAGCGTGNMAQVLHQMGYRNIEGLDPSSGMLAIAHKKEIYQQLHQLYLDTHIDLPRASYDGVVAAGVLTHGHAPPESLDGILEIAREGAVIVFSLSLIAFEDYGFKQKIEQLEDGGAWQKLDQSLLFRTYPFSEKEAHLRHWVLAYRKC
ncbi:MAG: class I SAM-dependent methyltransferase [Gammaproteobacteria bacterium]|nr:MAG: class I SAM-dependent methyltransferase [Gammaproteobacteria bacterium]